VCFAPIDTCLGHAKTRNVKLSRIQQRRSFSISSLFFPCILDFLLLYHTSYSLSLSAMVQNLLRLLGQTSLCAICEITLGEPLTGLDDLNNVDPLLEKHDGSRDGDQDPRDGTIHLVCSACSHLGQNSGQKSREGTRNND
jgi:hypothetical protein